jgi:SAM-dependent methyltransferase
MIAGMTAAGMPARPAEAAIAVRAAVREESVPPRLDEATYLRTQRIYEAHSDQRVRIAQWLCDRRPPLPRGARTRVLSIGCGDGTVDVALAASLVDDGRRLDYVGIEPSATAGETFLERLGELPGVNPTLVNSTLEDATLDGPFDLVVAIHSLYYVRDLPGQLRRLLGEGGSLIIMNAPLLGLNQLVEALAPAGDGTSLIYSDEVGDILDGLGCVTRRERIDAALDVSPTRDPRSDVGRDLLQFLTHADLSVVSPAFHQTLVDYLRAIAFVPGGTLVPHPVDVFVVSTFGRGVSRVSPRT